MKKIIYEIRRIKESQEEIEIYKERARKRKKSIPS
jgi:hypothetical protein